MNNIRYKIMSTPKEITDVEIKKYKDFNLLLKRNAMIQQRKLWYQRVFAVCLIAGLGSGVLLLYPKFSGTPSNSTHIKKNIITHVAATEDKSATLAYTDEIKKSAAPVVKKSESKSKVAATSASTKNTEENIPLINQAPVFQEASPEGGYNALFTYLKKQLQYPQEAKKNNLTGTVTVEFYINEKGHPLDITILQSTNSIFDFEASRLIHTMPAWKPAVVNGQPVSTRQVLPVTFTLQ